MTYEIQKDVPIETVVGMNGTFPLEAMDVGDMFEIDLAHEFQLDEFLDADLERLEKLARNLRASISRRASRMGIKLRFRRLDKRDRNVQLTPTLGIWRVK
tara:strand:- start:929 stop:1228 length:300 start_codon:yes stop_codon:yes gene_type:complete